MSVEKILSRFARRVSQSCRMEYDDAYQELAIKELQARQTFRVDFITAEGKTVKYNTYLTSVLDGYSKKLVCKSIKEGHISLDDMLDTSSDEDSGSSGNQRYIAFEEHRYENTEWKVVIEQVAHDAIDKFIMYKLLEGWQQYEIAEMLDYSQAAIRNRLNRYRDSMKAFGKEEVNAEDDDWDDWDALIPEDSIAC